MNGGDTLGRRPRAGAAGEVGIRTVRDPYYTGVIRYKGELFVGRHEALVSKETFLKVQEILDMRKRDGDRNIVHFHYLKGLLAKSKARKQKKLPALRVGGV